MKDLLKSRWKSWKRMFFGHRHSENTFSTKHTKSDENHQFSSLFTHIFTVLTENHGFIGMRKTDVENTINSEFDVNHSTYAFSSPCCNKGQKAGENHKSATKCLKKRHFAALFTVSMTLWSEKDLHIRSQWNHVWTQF